MTNTVKLDIIVRKDANKADNKKIRRDGYLLGNIVRKGKESVAISIKKDQFKKTLKQFGRNSVFTLNSGDEHFEVMVKEIQLSSKDSDFLHVDFQQVFLDEEVKAEVLITYSGLDFLESKKLVLHRHIEFLNVKGFPQAIPETIDLDLSGFEAGDNLYMNHIKLPEGITTEVDSEQLVASIGLPKFKETEETEEESAVVTE